MISKNNFIMIIMTIVTFIIVFLLLFLLSLTSLNTNLSYEEVKDISSKEIDALEALIKVYDNYLITYDGKKELESLTDLDKINFIDRLDSKTKKELGLDFNKGVPLARIKEVLQKYFGPNISFEPVNSVCYLNDGDYLIYNKEDKEYYAFNDYHAHGAFATLDIINYYEDGKKIVTDDSIKYEVSYLKGFALPNTSIYYSSYTNLITKSNPVVDLSEIFNDYDFSMTKSLLIDYKHNFNRYTYVFETKKDLSDSYLLELTNDGKRKKNI